MYNMENYGSLLVNQTLKIITDFEWTHPIGRQHTNTSSVKLFFHDDTSETFNNYDIIDLIKNNKEISKNGKKIYC